MTVDTDLIVLHYTKFGDNSIVLHTISREYGRRSFLVRNPGKKMSYFLPLNLLEADVAESNKSRLYIVRNVSPKYPLIGIRNNLYKNSITMFISEVLYRVVKDGAKEPGLYEWCEKSILILDALETDFSNFHLRFLLELAMALGFSPEVKDLQPFMGDKLSLMGNFMKASFEESMLIPFSGAVRNELAENLLRYIEYHSESSVDVRSLKVLRELFQ